MVGKATRAKLEAIAADRERGASELALDAARALLELASELPRGERLDPGLRDELATTLLRAQPEMAPFYRLAAAVLTSAGPADLRDRVAEWVRILEGDDLARAGAERVAADAIVLTYSRSGSVLAVLNAVRRDGRRPRILVGEGRPGYEGRSVAARLAGAGFDVEVYTDAGLIGRIAAADVVLIGADAVGRASFRNKIGSRALCAAAGMSARPVYVIADSSKFMPEDLWPDAAERAAGEVWSDPPAGVRARNPYFESVPLDAVEAVVTEAGPLLPSEVERRVESLDSLFDPLRALLGRLRRP